ncbi:arsenite methyltransferase-like [Tubulanus polymorphus]|uniref:arsenite methyltransferase-like n=1 Tax=Tubulanus polymorphus TaxID=672921 RepID=UPI003DA53C91
MASTEPGSLIEENVREYYGKTLTTCADLRTNVCKTTCNKHPSHIDEALKLVHEDVSSRYFGCGSVFPDCLTGASVLDLGCGSGRDSYTLSKLVGESGCVTGVDMTDEMLQVANRYVSWHTEKYGYSKPNVRFLKGYIENLENAGVQPNSYDIIVSNCVVNLTADKKFVFKEAFRALKVGGELYFSDMYCDQEVPLHLSRNQLLWGEGLGGALYWKNMVEMVRECGFSCPRLVNASNVKIKDEEIQKMLGSAHYVSATYRLFKLPRDRVKECVAVYNGKIEGSQKLFSMDHLTNFVAGEAREVDCELATILRLSRFRKYFQFSPSTGLMHEPDPFKYVNRPPTGSCC